MNRIRLGLCTVVALLLASVWPAWQAWRAQQGLTKARSLAELEMWDGVHQQLGRYLWLHSTHDEARLFIAEALVKDEQLPSTSTIPEALNHLARIPDTSPRAAEARLQEGRLHLLVLGQPAHAERALRRSCELDPQSLVAWYLLWKTLDLSGRSQLAEDVFWRVHELTPPPERAARLREWYMSQFYPATASPQLDRLLGFIGPREAPTELTEYRRLARFHEAEPREAISCAALARWFYLEGDPHQARKILNEFECLVGEEVFDPFFLATKTGVLFDLGEFQEAEACMAKWPSPHAGHEYWKWRAIMLDEMQGNGREALAAYDQALAVWPGPVDWRTRSRKANCLSRLRDLQTAEAERALAKQIEEQMEDKVHQEIRAALARLDDPAALNKIADYYRLLSRPREERCWREESQRLLDAISPSTGDRK